MIARNSKNAHSTATVRKLTRPHAKFEIFYLDKECNVIRVEVTARTIRGAVSKAKVARSQIVDAGVKSHGAWCPMQLDALDSLMGV
jgi:hypothetical protein